MTRGRGGVEDIEGGSENFQAPENLGGLRKFVYFETNRRGGDLLKN